MPVLAAFLLAFIPALLYAAWLYWLDHYEKEPKLLLGGVFVWGALVAAGGAWLVNTLFGISVYLVTSSEIAADMFTGSIVAPLSEETLKGLAVLLVFLVFRKEFDSVLDGIVYAGIVALGFAATENVLYMYERGFLEDGWEGLWFVFGLRVILGAWNHPLYTAFTGIGLAVARLNRNTLVRLGAPVLGWFMAVCVHSLHNTLASFVSGLGGLAAVFLVDWVGWLFMGLIIFISLRRERAWIQIQLKDEVESGVLSVAQYQTATSAGRRALAQLSALTDGRFGNTRRFYRLITDLAYTKHQLAQVGESAANSPQMVADLRQKAAALAARAAA
ncbi:MAG: PrsW family intramembrane metalloprotease [Anaerolineae bacterium]|nr:MAG: PrsW family intramembrane metalloprotease [Anaerolineae bacterium]